LDVEGLALGSVQAAVTGLRSLLDARDEAFGVDAVSVAASFASLTLLRVDGRTPEGFAPLSGFFPAADGWVRTHANYPHHAAALQKALGVAGLNHLAAALREMPALEIEEVVQAAGGVAAAVRSSAEWARTLMGQLLHDQPWISFDLTDRAPLLCLNPERRLSGIRVLDLTRVIAGPTGTRLLAALGADVLRIDPPQLPELLDQHLDTGFAKRSALADLRRPADRARLGELLATADVLSTGYRPGALARFGLHPTGLRARYPQLVVVTLDAWGRHGPWRRARGFDSIVQAATGIADLYGGTDTGSWRPGTLPVQALDHATGYGMAAAALALLARRARGAGAGSAHLSLAATAQLLLKIPGSPGRQRRLDPDLQSTRTPYGTLVHAPPPITFKGQPIRYPAGPDRYGSAALR
jgi:crotonobetainyl-CoA:carnitine CoA-transferase CaiB-like acyl-CoA transferase